MTLAAVMPTLTPSIWPASCFAMSSQRSARAGAGPNAANSASAVASQTSRRNCRSGVILDAPLGLLKRRKATGAREGVSPSEAWYADRTTKEQVKAILDRVLEWPNERQEDAAKVLMLMESQNESAYRLTDEQVAEVRRRRADPNARRLTFESSRSGCSNGWAN